MVKTLIILVLLFDGTLLKEPLHFQVEVSVHDCLAYGDMQRKAIAAHSWDDPRGSGWYLNDGRGTVQGFICQ